ncbi:MAG: sensor histidine kinase [Clostridia bacterium]|nr:sensor histidine kinase [Clostridia bacterium]
MPEPVSAKKGVRLHYLLISMLLAAFSTVLLFTFLTLSPRVTGLLSSNAVERTKETVLQGVKSLDLYADGLLTSFNYAADLLPKDADAEDSAWQGRLSFLVASRLEISAVALFDTQGNLIYSTAGSLDQPAQAVRDSAFFVNALERQGTASYFSTPHVQNLFGAKKTYVVSISRAEWFFSDGQYIEGVMMMDVEYTFLRSLIEKITPGRSGYVYLLDEFDELISHPYERAIDSGLFHEDLTAVQQKTLGITEDSREGRERVLIILTVGKTRWRMVGVAYIDEIKTLESAFVRILSVIMLCASLLSFACAMLAVHLVTRPITLVASSMQRVTGGDLNVTIPARGFREIRSVASAFNMMLSRIRSLMDQIVVEQEKKRLYELNALQAQINPHFLYNTLDSIIWMEERGRGREAIIMVSALARLFRIAISKGKSVITVAEELAHVRNYLIIQKMRFKDQFSYAITASDEAMKEDTLKLIVQPIVENCINHAIDRTQSEELHIQIDACTEGDRLFFTIRDDGIGISDEQVATLLTREAGSGIGLKNVHERIMLTYGGDYGLTIQSAEDSFTLVTVTLPRAKGN